MERMNQEQGAPSTAPPNKSLQRSALGIKCSAAGGWSRRSGERRRARVLTSQPAVAELNR
jgi:hypothetical protein